MEYLPFGLTVCGVRSLVCGTYGDARITVSLVRLRIYHQIESDPQIVCVNMRALRRFVRKT